jgi:hypothetical protein
MSNIMGLSPNIISAVVAGIVALLVSIITYIATMKSLKAKREDLNKQLDRGFTTQLYNLRLKHYPKAIEAIEKINIKNIADGMKQINTFSEIRGIYKELGEWRKGEVTLILSERSLKAFRNLRDALCKRPEKGEEYGLEQINKILHMRNAFSEMLRSDLGFLFSEEDE